MAYVHSVWYTSDKTSDVNKRLRNDSVCELLGVDGSYVERPGSYAHKVVDSHVNDAPAPLID